MIEGAGPSVEMQPSLDERLIERYFAYTGEPIDGSIVFERNNGFSDSDFTLYRIDWNGERWEKWKVTQSGTKKQDGLLVFVAHDLLDAIGLERKELPFDQDVKRMTPEQLQLAKSSVPVDIMAKRVSKRSKRMRLEPCSKS